jgi:glycosyltransferase involved in cell wall biosynthesis
MSLSTFFVVKDEAPTMLRALESVLEITDQYVIGIDDKSSDGTRAIVEQFRTNHPEKEYDIYDFTWQNHFANTRNEAISRCTKDWIFQLDGHEYLYRGSVQMMQKYMQNTQPHIWLISVRMYLEPIWGIGSKEVIPEVLFMQTHLWKNLKAEPAKGKGSRGKYCVVWAGNSITKPDKKWKNYTGIRYEHASHNAITSSTCPLEHRMNTPDIIIIHDRPHENAEKRRKQREKMNTPHFVDRLKDDPTDERGLFYGTMSFVDASVKKNSDGTTKYLKGKLRRAIPLARRYMKHHGHRLPEQAFEMASKLGEVCREIGLNEQRHERSPEEMFREAEIAFADAKRVQPQRAEAYYQLGVLTMDRMEWEGIRNKLGFVSRQEMNNNLHRYAAQADRWLRLSTQIPVPPTNYFVRAPMYGFLPWLKLAELHRAAFVYTGLQEYFNKSREAMEALKQIAPHNIGVDAMLDELMSLYKDHRLQVIGKGSGKRLAIFNSTGQFTRDLISKFKESGLDVRQVDRPESDAAIGADIIFHAWADKNAAILTNQKLDAPQYVRLCRYEAYSDFPNQINWANVKGLIVPSDTMRDYVKARFAISCPVHVIHHGLDLDKYHYEKRAHGPNVAFIGYINARKNLSELADVVKACPDKHFHIAGLVQHPDVWRMFMWKIRKYECENRVTYHGWQDDIDKWLDNIDANYLLSTSWGESFGYAIAEASAKGIMPVIRDFEGADSLWPKWAVYDTIEDVKRRFNHRVDYRDPHEWIAERFDVKDEAKHYMELFDGN